MLVSNQNQTTNVLTGACRRKASLNAWRQNLPIKKRRRYDEFEPPAEEARVDTGKSAASPDEPVDFSLPNRSRAIGMRTPEKSTVGIGEH